MEFSSKNNKEGSHFLLEDVFPIQGLNPCLKLHWQAYTDYHFKNFSYFSFKPLAIKYVFLNKLQYTETDQ